MKEDKILSREDLFKRLENVPKINFATASKKEALAFCAEVMDIFAKTNDDVELNEGDNYVISYILRSHGCLKYKEAVASRPEFIPSKDTMGELINEGFDLGFPLTVFTNIVDVEDSTFDYARDMAWGKNNWCEDWVKSYHRALKNEETETL